MTEPANKTLSIQSLHLQSWGMLSMRASELEAPPDYGVRMHNVLSEMHIYLLCKRPVFTFNPAAFAWSDGNVQGEMHYINEGKAKTIPFNVPFSLSEDESGVALSKEKQDEVLVLDQSGQPARKLSAYTLSQYPQIISKYFSNDLEVMYVGNVFSENKSSIIDRIRGDADILQLIERQAGLLDTEEIILYVFQYLPYKLLPFLGAFSAGRASVPEGEARFVSTEANPVTEHEKVCFIQAGLIDLFKPEWNQINGNWLRTADKQLFTACDRFDISGIMLEITTEKSSYRLGSKAVVPLPRHMSMISLMRENERNRFFSV